MDKKILIGVLILLGIFVIYRFVASDEEVSYDEIQAEKRADNQAKFEAKKKADLAQQNSDIKTHKRENRNQRKHEQTASFETNTFSAKFTTLGGALKSLTLKDSQYTEPPRNWDTGYRNQETELVQVDLVTTNAKARFEYNFPLRFEIFEGIEGWLKDVDYELIKKTKNEIVFKLSQENQPIEIVKKFQLVEDETRPYQFWMTVQIKNVSDNKVTFIPGVLQTGYQHESEAEGGMFSRQPNLQEAICLTKDDDLFHSTWHDIEHPHFKNDVMFTGIETNYFISAMIPGDERPTSCKASAVSSNVIHAELRWGEIDILPGESEVFKVKNYMGPKKYQLLQTVGVSLEQSVDYGWFAPISRILLWLLFKFQSLVSNWGVAIILLTVLVKLVLMPLTHKSFQSSDRMKALKPEIDKLNEQFKDNPQEKQKAIMAMYKQHNVNPLGGCLPMVLQMPIWFALFRTLRSSPELYHAEFFGWIHDLASPDPYYITPIVMGAAMFLQQRMMPMATDNAQAKMMLYFMPIMFTGMMLFLPSGLTLYILVNTVLSVLHQAVIHKKRMSAAAGGSK